MAELNHLELAHMIAKDHKLRIVKVSDKKVVAGVVGFVDAWVIYRLLGRDPLTQQFKTARLGKSSKPARVLFLVKKFAGVTENPQPRAA